MFESWSYLSYFLSLTQNINGNLNKEFGSACLSTSGWEVSTFRYKVLNFSGSFGTLISEEPDVICLLSMSRPELHFIEQSALRSLQRHLMCISYFSVRHQIYKYGSHCMYHAFLLNLILCSENIVLPEKQCNTKITKFTVKIYVAWFYSTIM